MNNSLVRQETETRRLAAAAPRELTEDEVEILKTQIAPGVTNGELAFFLKVCGKTGLDPLLGQIYAVKFERQPMFIHIGVSGLRLIAERSGTWEGTLGPYWCGRDRVWHDVWLDEDPPLAARFGVLKRGFREPIWAVATMRDYRKRSPLWDKSPAEMLGKVAESHAFKRGWPAETQQLERQGVREAVLVDADTGEIVETVPASSRPEVTAALPSPPAGRPVEPTREAVRATETRASYAGATRANVPATAGPPLEPFCGCGKPLTANQWTLSTRRFGQPLCPACQKKAARQEPQQDEERAPDAGAEAEAEGDDRGDDLILTGAAEAPDPFEDGALAAGGDPAVPGAFR